MTVLTASPAEVVRYPDLAGKVAVVTGGTRGIGADTCLGLAANGVKVAVCGRDQAAAEKVVAAVTSSGGQAIIALSPIAPARPGSPPRGSRSRRNSARSVSSPPSPAAAGIRCRSPDSPSRNGGTAWR